MLKFHTGNKGKLNVKIDGETISNLEGTGLQKINVAYPEYGEVDIIAKIDKISEMQSEIIRNEAKINSILELHKINNIFESNEFYKDQKSLINDIDKIEAEKRGISKKTKEELNSEYEKLQLKIDEYKNYKRSDNAVTMNPYDSDLSKMIKLRENELEKINFKLNDLKDKKRCD